MALGVQFFEQDLTEVQIEPVGTEGVVLGYFPQGPIAPTQVTKVEQFNSLYGTGTSYAAIAARNFLRNSERLTVQRVVGLENTNYPTAYPGWVLGGSSGGLTESDADGCLLNVVACFFPTGTGGSAFSQTKYYSVSTTYYTGNDAADFNPNFGIAVLATVAVARESWAFQFVTGTVSGGTYAADVPSATPIDVKLSSTAADRDSLAIKNILSGSSVADGVYTVTVQTSPTTSEEKKISFNPASDLYIGKVLNNDIERLGQVGHAVVAKYDWVYNALKNFYPNSASSSVYLSVNKIGPYSNSYFTSRDFSGYASQALTPYIHSQLFGGTNPVGVVAGGTLTVKSTTLADFDAGTISILSTDGTLKTYKFDDDGADGATGVVLNGNVVIQISGKTTELEIAEQIAAAINNTNGHSGKITASAAVTGGDGVVTLTQVVPGSDGNTPITVDNVLNASTTLVAANFSGGIFSGQLNPGGATTRLFRFRAKQHGVCSNGLRVHVTNIRKSSEPGYDFGQFDVLVKDQYGKLLETWTNLTLDPDQERFITKVLGDQYPTFDSTTNQLVYTGKYSGDSQFVTVDLAVDSSGRTLETAPGEYCSKAAVPWGFEGYQAWAAMMSNATNQATSLTSSVGPAAAYGAYTVGGLSKTPLIARQYINGGWTTARPWGVRVTKYGSDGSETDAKVNNLLDETLADRWQYLGAVSGTRGIDYAGWSHPKYFMSASDGKTNVCYFSLHHVSGTSGLQVTGSSQLTSINLRKLVYNTDMSYCPLLNFEAIQGTGAAQFELVLANGHNGWLPTLFQDDDDPTKYIGAGVGSPTFTGTVVVSGGRQLGGSSSRLPTNNIYAASLMTSLSILENTNDAAAVAVMPGVRNDIIVQRLLDVAAAKGDMWAIVDIGALGDSPETVRTDRTQTLNYDTSYGSLYSRWVRVSLGKGKSAWVPPSVVMAGVVSQSDRLAFPWYAPAGTSRGALKEFDVTAVDRSMTAKEVSDLNGVQVNVLIKNKGAFVAWGNETMRQKLTALNQISIRRMTIEAKRVIGNAVQQLVFEPNNATTWTKFKNIVNPQLDLIKRNNGIEEFLVVADDTTTTLLKQKQGIMVGKIIVRPTYSIKSIEIPFTIADTAVATFDESAT